MPIFQGNRPDAAARAALGEIDANAGDVIPAGETRFIDSQLWTNETAADITVPDPATNATLSAAGLTKGTGTGHAHSNKAVLDGLTEAGGKLNYNGTEVAGDKVTKPAGAQDNHVPRFDSNTGEIQNSTVVVEDNGDMSIAGDLTADNLTLSGATKGHVLKASNPQGDLVFKPEGPYIGTVAPRGRIQRVFEHFNGTALDEDYMHIKTPINVAVSSAMFHFKITGYLYGASTMMDLEFVGYSYVPSTSLINSKAVDKTPGSPLTDVAVYKGSDDCIYLRFKNTASYFQSIFIDHLVVGNGQPFTDLSGFQLVNSAALTL